MDALNTTAFEPRASGSRLSEHVSSILRTAAAIADSLLPVNHGACMPYGRPPPDAS